MYQDLLLPSPRVAVNGIHDLRRPPTPATRLRRVAILGNHLPRQCGIATFTTDLRAAIAEACPEVECLVVAMNDAGTPHTYPPEVRFSVADNDVAAYRRAADFLNSADIDALSVQHEYGIFGGRAGALVLTLLRSVRMPVVTTLHTVLATPDAVQRRVLDDVIALSERLVVMSTHSAALLQSVHRVAADRIDVIPHGIPSVMFAPGTKDVIGVAGRQVMLTFGLLSPDKGIEYVVDAMPAIVAAHPDVVYIVLGATHPHVLDAQGEAYRLQLQARARQLGVAGHMIFHNRFVSQQELGEFVSAADLYLTPYLNPEQSTSGTLAYALGAGKAMISTPYRYATEVLADGRGVIVPSRDASAIADAVIARLSDVAGTAAMRRRAAAYGQSMRWSSVARQHVTSLTRAVTHHADVRRAGVRARTLAEGSETLPPMALDHLLTLTDDTAVLQHARYSVPRYEDGYCLDDTARALLLVARLEDSGAIDRRLARRLSTRYLAFVGHAFVPETGRFRNFMRFTRRWSEAHGSDDSQGRALWALGTVVGRGSDPGHRQLANEYFHAGLAATAACPSPRAWAYALLGIDEYLRIFGGETRVEEVRATLTARLHDCWLRTHTTEWPWFEAHATYGNARLPQALLLSGHAMGRPDLVAIALRALEWLRIAQTTPDGDFAPIGSDGFYTRGEALASFDQQPVEACGMVAACFDAARLTGDPKWSAAAATAFRWFLGGNHLRLSLLDPSTGGCKDGLHADRANENQGAESTISYLQALCDMRAAQPSDLP
jgi:glycosyltransferase involved in cell wall biosynthesis